MILDRVTFTGADDSVDHAQLVEISRQYPWVEWGILFSSSRQGSPRYPSQEWIHELNTARTDAPMLLSAHLCGRWVRDLVLEARPSWFDAYKIDQAAFGRIQLNFHGEFHRQHQRFLGVLFNHQERDGAAFILQCDGVSDGDVRDIASGHSVVPLFDTSGGAGRLPVSWPEAWPGVYCGYAGGLGPANVLEQLDLISKRVPAVADIWIDMERRVRSDDDALFDLDRVRAVLAKIAPFVTAEAKV